MEFLEEMQKNFNAMNKTSSTEQPNSEEEKLKNYTETTIAKLKEKYQEPFLGNMKNFKAKNWDVNWKWIDEYLTKYLKKATTKYFVDEGLIIIDQERIQEIKNKHIQEYREKQALKPKRTCPLKEEPEIFKVSNDWYYVESQLQNSGMAIFGYAGKEHKVIIPRELEGVEVNFLSETWWKGNKKFTRKFFDHPEEIEEIVIQNNIKGIADYLFSHLPNLRSVKFEDCEYDASSIMLLKSQQKSFEDGYHNGFYPGKILGNHLFIKCPKLVDENGFVIVDGNLIDYYGNESNLVIPKNVKCIDAYECFNKCESLTIPGTCKGVYYSSLPKNSDEPSNKKLKNIVLGEGCIETSLSHITGSSTVESITYPSSLIDKHFTITNFSNLKEIKFNEGIKEIWELNIGTFDNEVSIYLPSTLEEVYIFWDGYGKKPVFCGVEGSYAEKAVKKEKFKFIAVDKQGETPTVQYDYFTKDIDIASCFPIQIYAESNTRRVENYDELRESAESLSIGDEVDFEIDDEAGIKFFNNGIFIGENTISWQYYGYGDIDTWETLLEKNAKHVKAKLIYLQKAAEKRNGKKPELCFELYWDGSTPEKIEPLTKPKNMWISLKMEYNDNLTGEEITEIVENKFRSYDEAFNYAAGFSSDNNIYELVYTIIFPDGTTEVNGIGS